MTDTEYVPAFEAPEPECPHPGFKKCPVVISEQVCIQANVSIDPKVKIGYVRAFCDEPVIGKCSRVTCSHEPCEFIVSQTICVEIPLEFSVDTKVDPAGHICAPPEITPCPKCMDENT